MTGGTAESSARAGAGDAADRDGEEVGPVSALVDQPDGHRGVPVKL